MVWTCRTRFPIGDVGEYCPLRQTIDLIVEQQDVHVKVPCADADHVVAADG